MKLIKPSPNSKYFIRDDIFKGLTPEDCYWLGVIVADGCIRLDGNNKKAGHNCNSYKITLAWQEKDLHHLKKFRDYLGDSNRGIVSNPSKDSHCYQVNVQGLWLKDRVERFGIIPRKTVEYFDSPQPPTYIKSFIAGWFDGDGYFNSRKNKETLNITGEHRSLLWLKSLVEDCGYTGTSYVNPIKGKNASRFHINGRLQCLKFFEIFYDESLCLQRKWNSFKNL